MVLLDTMDGTAKAVLSFVMYECCCDVIGPMNMMSGNDKLKDTEYGNKLILNI